MNELISIIVPIYNAGKTINRCVDSLIGQTYKNIEIILVNDGSKDDSLLKCRQYESVDSRIKVIDKVNGGVSSARNAGLDIAKGDFIMFCDSDDWADLDWCEELINNYKDDCLIMCGHYVEGEQNYLPYEVKSIDKRDTYARKEFFKLKLMNFYAPWNKIYNNQVIKNNGLKFNERLSNGEDLLFNLNYLNCISGEIILLNKCVFHYVWPSSKSLSVNIPINYFSQCCLLTDCIFSQCELLEVNDTEGLIRISTDRYNEFQKIIISIARDKSLNYSKQIKEITELISSPQYKKCTVYAQISPNKIYCWLSHRKNGFGLWLWHKLR